MIPALSNHLWQSTLFGLAAALVAAALRRNGAHIRHLVWLTASLKFLLPFSLLLSLGSQFASTRPASPADALPIETVSVVMDQIAQPFSDVVAAPAQAPAPDRTSMLIAIVWALGFASILVIRLRGWRNIRSAVRASVPITLPGVDVPPQIDVRVSPGLVEPGVVGFLRPILLLPAGIETRLTLAQMQAVVAHELCHIRRRDNATAALHMVVEAMFWFHPIVWWVGARMVEERERSCDEHVLRALGTPEAYAEGILNVCKLYAESPLTCVAGVTGSNLKKRIEAIMVNRTGLQLNLARKAAIISAAVFAVAAPIVVGMITAPVRMLASNQQPAAPALANQRFEVASIKPCTAERPMPAPAGGGAGGGAGRDTSTRNSSPGRIQLDCVRLASLVDTAFVQRNHATTAFDGWAGTGSSYGSTSAGPLKVRGGSSWIYDERWTVEAKASGPVDEDTMMGPMLRALLEDRFRVKLHIATEDAVMWTLNVAKGGLKITPIKEGDCNPDPSAQRVIVSRAKQEGIKPTCGLVSGDANGPNWRWEHGGQTLAVVASMASVSLGAPVLDRTGVADKFNIVWEFGPDENTPRTLQTMQRFASAAGQPTAANIFTALEEQLGLKLEKTTAPRGYIVIDGAERPTPDFFSTPTLTSGRPVRK